MTDAEKNRFLAEALEPEPSDYSSRGARWQDGREIRSSGGLWRKFFMSAMQAWSKESVCPLHDDGDACFALIAAMDAKGWLVIIDSRYGWVEFYRHNVPPRQVYMAGGDVDCATDIMRTVRDAAYWALKPREE